MNIIEACRDRKLFGSFFRDAATWAAWMTVLRSVFGLPLADSERELFTRCTGRSQPFAAPVTEGWLVCGRRSGKSFVAALIATFLAAFRDYSAFLSPGERGVVTVLAVSREQAKVIFRYIEAFFDGVPMLSRMVAGRTAESLDLTNGISIEVHTSSFRSVRGRTIVAALCDEIAFWRSDDSANPDKEVLAALRPAMATIPNALLLCLSSPYARRGALFEAFEHHHGNDASDVLVWRAPTLVMNPTIRQSVITRSREADPAAAAAEWDAEFRSDVEAFLDDAWITAAVDVGCHERAPVSSRSYWAFVDPSGGKKDSFTLGVAHREGERGVLDLIREWRPPFDPGSVVAEIAGLVKPYRVAAVTGDAYSGEWVQSTFRKAGLGYQVSKKDRSSIYLETGPSFARGLVRLVDNPRLTGQLRQLERRTSPGGRDRVNHPPGGHDDLANSAMGALWLASQRGSDGPTWTQPVTLRGWEPFDGAPAMRPGPPAKRYEQTPAERAASLRALLDAQLVKVAEYRAKAERGEVKARAVDREEKHLARLRREIASLTEAPKFDSKSEEAK